MNIQVMWNNRPGPIFSIFCITSNYDSLSQNDKMSILGSTNHFLLYHKDRVNLKKSYFNQDFGTRKNVKYIIKQPVAVFFSTKPLN